jgi:outer membrane protein assembly factor BamB
MNQSDADALALSLLKQSQRHCAMISVPHCGSGELAIGFWNAGGGAAKGGDNRLLIDAFESAPAQLATAQANVTALGLMGRNMYVRSGALSTKEFSMPYADNFCDMVAITDLADADLSTISYNEVERVLCMGAKAWVGRAAVEGPGMTATALTKWIGGTHALSSATVVTDATGMWAVITKIDRLPDTYEGPHPQAYSGSWFYNDKKATWPCLPQWYAKPYGISLIQTKGYTPESRFTVICSGGGRIYGSEIDSVPRHHSAERKYGQDPYKPLAALRAYNGQFLWTRSDLGGRVQAWSRGVVCNDKIIDGETGDPSLDKTILLPKGSVYWSAILDDIYYAVVTDGGSNTLFAYSLANNVPVYTIAGFDDNQPLPPIPLVFPKGVGPSQPASEEKPGAAAADAEQPAGAAALSSPPAQVAVDSSEPPTLGQNGKPGFQSLGGSYNRLTMVMAGGKVYSYSGSSIYCHKLADGSKLWGPVKAPAAINYLRASESGVLVQSGTTNKQNLYFLSATDGSVKWGPEVIAVNRRTVDIGQSDKFNGGREFVVAVAGDGTAYDLLTGKKLEQSVTYGATKGGCGEGSMTPAGTFSQGNGMEFSFPMGQDVVKGANTYITPCTDEAGAFATSGMTIYENKGCCCYGVILGTKAEAPRGSFDSEQPAVESDRLEKGPAYDNLQPEVMPDAKDWPTHRANNNRNASTPAQVATDKCVQLWKYTNPTPNTYTAPSPDDHIYTYQDITPPVTAGGYTYIAGSDGVLKCFENATGKNLWNYVTGGWIFATPTIANGCVYVGSGDGYAYCIEAQSGKLVWRFRAAPAERRFNYFGHLISTWPILTGILVHSNGLAYFESGIRDEYGVQAYAVDARTGSLAKGWQNTQVGVHWVNRPGLGRIGHIPGGYMAVLGSNLYVKEPDRPIEDMVLQKDWETGGQPQRMGVFNLQTGEIPKEDNMRMTPRYDPPGAGRGYDASGRQIAVIGNYLMGWGEELHSEAEYKRYGGDVTFIQIGDSGNPVQPFMNLPAMRGRNHIQYDCFAWDNQNLFLDTDKYDMPAWKKWMDSTVQSGDDLLDLPDAVGGQWNPGKQKGHPRAMALTANCLVVVNSGGDIRVLDRNTGNQLFDVSSGGETYDQALAIDRDGRIIVGNRNGDVVCYGSPRATSSLRPSDKNSVANK